MRYMSFFLAAAGHVAGLSAQTAKPDAAATESITASEMARHVRALSGDAMMRRDTSSGIAMTAQYVAEQFRQLGLRPGGDIERGTMTGPDTSTSWFQRYPLPGHLAWDDERSQLTLSTRLGKGTPDIVDESAQRVEKRVALRFGADAWLAADTVPESGAASQWKELASLVTVVIAGPHTPASVQQASLRNTLVFYVPPAGTPIAVQQQVIADLAGANKVIVIGTEDSVTTPRSVVVVNRYMEEALNVRGWAVRVRSGAVTELLTAAGFNLAQLRAERAAVIRNGPAMQAELTPGFKTVATNAAMGVNVVGVLEGRGPKFTAKESEPWTEYIVIMARMDSLASPRGATNVAGLLTLAKAFSQPDARPRRSLLFVALSGDAEDVRGSDFFMHQIEQASRPVMLERIATALAFDLRGDSVDSVWVAGLQDLEFPKRPEWIIAEHPELGLSVLDDGTNTDLTAAHVAFARKAVPSLYLHTAHEAEGSALTDVEHAARMLRAVFHVGYNIADTDARPRWSTVGRRNRLTRFGQ